MQDNREMYLEFIDESLEMLGDVDVQLLELEKNPDDLTIIQSIFRPIHTIKGNSSFFELAKIKEMSHALENLLDLLRKNKLTPSKKVVDALLAGVDFLSKMFANARQDKEEADNLEEYRGVLSKIVRESDNPDSNLKHVALDIKDNLYNLTLLLQNEQSEVASEIERIYRQLESLNLRRDTKKERLLENLPPLAAEIIEIIDKSRENGPTKAETLKIGQNLSALKQEMCTDRYNSDMEDFIDNYHIFLESVGFDDLLVEMILEKIQFLSEKGVWTFECKDNEKKVAVREEKREEEKPSTSKTMRVFEDDIDSFLSFVGELIVVGDMFNNLQSHIFSRYSDVEMLKEFKRVTRIFEDLSNKLQKSIMDIRKAPIKPILKKLPRIVRDIADGADKKINVQFEGENVRVDKSLLDIIDGPLVHMVRNSADHGIESVENRKKIGKEPEGRILISFREKDEKLHMVVSDDGKGLNIEAIKEKALSMGLIKGNREITNDEIVDLLFSSGLSTAEKVTEISGRGVGMDVVKKAIEKIGGVISVDFEEGKGTSFSLVLPLSVTTQIIRGFLLDLSGQCYVIPINKVFETLKIDKNDVKSTMGKSQYIDIRGELMKVIDLHENLWGYTLDRQEKDFEIFVAAESEKRRFALRVDNVIGVQNMVIKEIEGMNNQDEVIQGGALMGDGSVALILDVDKLARDAA